MSNEASLLTRLRTAFALGPRNIVRVATYRLRLRLGIHPVQRLGSPAVARAPFFRPAELRSPLAALPAWPEPDGYFGWFRPAEPAAIPDWFHNPLSGTRANGADRPWWDLPDFDPSVGDIKGIWEASRFDWVVRCAQRAATGDSSATTRLNDWLEDWSEKNPPYRGPNWKCGQEASIRVMHLAVAARIVAQVRAPERSLVQLLVTHLRRIAPTLSYAVGQDNNHGTSEAAALFIGGSWLELVGEPGGAEYALRGRDCLEERARRLIARDGTFSQYSVNYHRLMLDTFSLVELWRRDLGLAPFSADLGARVATAVAWLGSMVDPVTGDGPNIGANDGANLLPLTDAPYRDYRPSVQLGAALFRDERWFESDDRIDTHLGWLGVETPRASARRHPPHDADGYRVLRNAGAMAVLRVPRHRFRPGHADPLHVDLWVDGVNCLRDDGTFSYNADSESMSYFGGVGAHNTVKFDDREPMPRISRFLWGDWIQATDAGPPPGSGERLIASSGYSTSSGAVHEREVALSADHALVTDRVRGFTRRAVWHWRLRPGPWVLNGSSLTDGQHVIHVEADAPIVRMELEIGWESRLYGRRTEVPVLVVELSVAATVRTVYRWRP